MSKLIEGGATLHTTGWHDDALPDDVELVREVTRKTLKRHVETSAYFATSDRLGYERQYQKGETMAGSRTVTYHRAKIGERTAWVIMDTANGYAVFVKRDLAEYKAVAESQPGYASNDAAVIDQALRIMEAQFKRGDETFTTADAVKRYCRLKIGDRTREHFLALYLDSQMQLIHANIEFTGSLNSAAVYPRVIAKNALLLDASNVILCHNHPSGKVAPSDADIRVTKDIKQSLALFDITLQDHVIVSSTDAMTFAQQGVFF